MNEINQQVRNYVNIKLLNKKEEELEYLVEGK